MARRTTRWDYDDDPPQGLKEQVGYFQYFRQWDPFADAADRFAMNVKFAATAKGWSIQELARRSGLAERTLWSLLNIQTANPQLSTLVFLSETLGVTPSDLLLEHRRFKAQISGRARRRRR